MYRSQEYPSLQCAYQKQLYYWDQWNRNVGPACYDNYGTFVEKSNLAAELNGYEDTGDSWREGYEDEDFQIHLDGIWNGKTLFF